MTHLSFFTRLRHLVITSRWQRWLFATLCFIPYVAVLIMLLSRGLIGVSPVLLAPVLMGGVLGLMTLWLANAEFRTRLRKR